jgi:electron transport complex protein RnfC
MKILKSIASFHGGVHPAYHKDLASGQAIKEMPLPALLRVSMSQHLGAPAKPVVKKGETVLRGQVIGEAAGFISAPVHAPTSGTVKLVGSAKTASGRVAAVVDIEPDGEDAWLESMKPHPDWESLDGKALVELIAKAGVAGMGGAGFPTNVKLSPPPDKPIDTLIVNGAECEPYLTADHRLMVEQAEGIWTGVKIIRKVLGVKQVRVAIEDNKPDAIAAMEKVMAGDSGDCAVVALKTEYPQGAEKQQIYSVTGREVPSGGLPMDVGCVVENVGTCLAIRDAVINGRPLTERVTTVTGLPVAQPGNVLARIGTSYADLVEFCGGTNGAVAKVISGGPMMGFAQDSYETTTTKTTSGLLLLPPGKVHGYASTPCISCGRCVDACPMNLVPSELSQMLEAEAYDDAEDLNVMDCIECGCCAFVCPAHRPLVQHMRQGKAEVQLKRRKEKAKAAR